MTPSNLTHHFLIAMPHMADPRFAQSLIYLCEHNAEGAMGLIINQPSQLSLADLLEGQLPALAALPQISVFDGGPVEPERGFVLHQGSQQWQSSIDLGALQLTTSRDILRDLAAGDGPQEVLIALGYAGWGAGQLEQELADNAWLSCPADRHILFHLPCEQRLNAAARSLGVDLNLMTSQSGRA